MSKKQPDTKKRLSNGQWEELLSLLSTGQYTQDELAKNYGVSAQSIIKRRKKIPGGLKIGENAPHKLVTPTQEDIKNSPVSKAVGDAMSFGYIEQTQLINKAKRQLFNRIDVLGKLTESAVRTAIVEKNLESKSDFFKIIIDLQKIFENDLKLKGKALGFKNEDYSGSDELPELIVMPYTEAEVAEIKEQMSDGDDDAAFELDDISEQKESEDK